MSHFSTLKTNVSDPDALRRAILEVGSPIGGKFQEQHVICQTGLTLYGYTGDDRSRLKPSDPNYAPLCEVVIRRQTIGEASNDVGFSRGPDGNLQAHISDWDEKWFGAAWLNKVQQRYGVIKAKEAALANPRFADWAMDEETDQETGDIRLRFRQRQAAEPSMARL